MPIQLLKKFIVAIPTIFLLSGCASQIDAVLGRAVVEDDIMGIAGTLSLQADRRIVLIPLEGEHKGKFCAEPPPDVALNVDAGLKASIEASLKDEIAQLEAEGKGSVEDALKKTAVALTERTAALDVFRTGTYALCQYYLAGAMTREDVNEQFKLLTEGAYKVLEK